MMRNLYFLIPAFFSLVLFSCTKKDDTKQAGFQVNGIADIKIKANRSGSLSLSIEQVSGDQETVSLSLSGTPANVQHEFSTASGTPTYASVLTVTGNYATPGTYPLTLTATGASGANKGYNFSLVIEEAEDCAAKMTGAYGGTATCGSGAGSYSVEKDPGQVNGIIFKQGNNMYRDTRAVLNCENNTISVPEQTYTDGSATFKVKGSGSFVPPASITLTLEWDITTIAGGTKQTCSYNFIK